MATRSTTCILKGGKTDKYKIYKEHKKKRIILRIDLYTLTLINECRSTFSSNYGTVTPNGLLRIQKTLSIGQMESKKKGRRKME